MSDFPTLTVQPDSSKYERTHENQAVRTEMEGGYVYTRPRFTRTARLMWKIAYTELEAADHDSLVTFYNTVRGGSDYFNWTDPEDDTVYVVRFTTELKFKYRGMKTTSLWDVEFELEQV